jgi:hypothetical protein
MDKKARRKHRQNPEEEYLAHSCCICIATLHCGANLHKHTEGYPLPDPLSLFISSSLQGVFARLFRKIQFTYRKQKEQIEELPKEH